MQQQQYKWLPLWVIKFWVGILFSRMLLLWKCSGDTGYPLKETAALQKTKKRAMASELFFPLEMQLMLNFQTLQRFFWCPGHLKEHSWRCQLWEAMGWCSIPAGWAPSSWVMHNTPSWVREIMGLSGFVLAHGQSLEKSCWMKQASYLWKFISHSAKVLIDSGVAIPGLRGAMCILTAISGCLS